jgi:tetratricopeptide (TPR) repeat protein
MEKRSERSNVLIAAGALQSADRHDEALYRLRESGDQFSHELKTAFALAISYQETRLYSQAVDVLLQAIARAPHNYGLQVELSKVYLSVRDYELAKESLFKALESDPKSPNSSQADPVQIACLRLLALCAAQIGDDAQAKSAILKAIELHPGNAFTHAVHGKVAFKCGDYAAAKIAYAQALSLDPENESARTWQYDMQISEVIYSKPFYRKEEVLAMLASATQKCPEYAQGHYLMGQLFAQAGKTRKALAAYKCANACSDATTQMVQMYHRIRDIRRSALSGAVLSATVSTSLLVQSQMVNSFEQKDACIIVALIFMCCPILFLSKYFRP